MHILSRKCNTLFWQITIFNMAQPLSEWCRQHISLAQLGWYMRIKAVKVGKGCGDKCANSPPQPSPLNKGSLETTDWLWFWPILSSGCQTVPDLVYLPEPICSTEIVGEKTIFHKHNRCFTVNFAPCYHPVNMILLPTSILALLVTKMEISVENLAKLGTPGNLISLNIRFSFKLHRKSSKARTYSIGKIRQALWINLSNISRGCIQQVNPGVKVQHEASHKQNHF